MQAKITYEGNDLCKIVEKYNENMFKAPDGFFWNAQLVYDEVVCELMPKEEKVTTESGE